MAQLHRRQSSRTALSSEWGRFIHRWHRARFVRTALWSDLSPVEWLLLKLERNLYMANASWLLTRELTAATGPWDETLAVDDDGEYFARLLVHSDGTRFVNGARMYYRTAHFGTVSDIDRSHRKMDAQMRSMRLHTQYIRSLDDSPTVRSACVTFLQTAIVYFYDERPDLVAEAQQLANALGGTLTPPRLSKKYAWLASLFGRRTTRRVAAVMTRVRWSFTRLLDKALQHVERFTIGEPTCRPASRHDRLRHV